MVSTATTEQWQGHSHNKILVNHSHITFQWEHCQGQFCAGTSAWQQVIDIQRLCRRGMLTLYSYHLVSGIILGVGPPNGRRRFWRRRFKEMPSLIGRAHTKWSLPLHIAKQTNWVDIMTGDVFTTCITRSLATMSCEGNVDQFAWGWCYLSYLRFTSQHCTNRHVDGSDTIFWCLNWCHSLNQCWLNVDSPQGTNLSKISINILKFSLKKMHLKCRLQSCGHLVSASMC